MCGGRQAINLNFYLEQSNIPLLPRISLVSDMVPKYQVAKTTGDMPSLQGLLACIEAGHGILHRQ